MTKFTSIYSKYMGQVDFRAVSKLSFYLQEGDCWELSAVNDVRPGARPTEDRYHQQLVKKHGDNVYEKSIIVCSGANMVDVVFQNIIFAVYYIRIFKHIYVFCILQC